jgi:putative membrane protein
MRYRFLGCILAAFAVSQPALAQTAAAPAAQQAAVSNDEFRRLALIGESFDYESSRLALTHSSRPSIKRYATSLMGNFRFDYARLASGAGVFSSIPALPPDPNTAPAPFTDDRRAKMLNQLSSATGRDFDRLYTDMQLGTRQEVLGLYEAYTRTGSDPALLTFARERLPLLQQQFQVARRLARR